MKELDLDKVHISTHKMEDDWNKIILSVLDDKHKIVENLIEALHRLRTIEILGKVDHESINNFLKQFEK